jgi:RNA polymerase sigma-70 factor (ECF subfamily)
MAQSGEHTTQMLVSRIRAGDPAARAALVRRVEPLLVRFAHGRVPQLLRHEHDTADLVQMTWLRVLDKIGHLAVDQPGDFFSYLRTVLLNSLREALRKHGRSGIDVHGDDLAAAADVPADNVAPDDWLAYEQAVAALPPDARVLVLMRFEFGMSFAEIAEEFGETPDAMRMRVNRAIARIAGDVDGEQSG